MRCLVCGKEDYNVICNDCKSKVDESYCYDVATFNYDDSNNELWKSIADSLESRFLFKDYALDIAELLSSERVDYIKLRCLDIKQRGAIGVSSYDRERALELVIRCEENLHTTADEKNYALAIALSIYVAKREWEKAEEILNRAEQSEQYIVTYLAVADFYIKTRRYEEAEEILDRAFTIFVDAINKNLIEELSLDNKKRASKEKKDYAPTNAKDKEVYFEFLDSIGVDYKTSNETNKKIKEADFKQLHYYQSDVLPDSYSSIWFETEFHQVVYETVQFNAVKVRNGEIVGEFSELVHPIKGLKSAKKVKLEDVLKARSNKDVFRDLMAFLGDDVIAIAGFDANKSPLIRAARYAVIDEIKNEILDVVAYIEDRAEDFDIRTRESVLNEYGIEEGNSGIEKARVTVELMNKLG